MRIPGRTRRAVGALSFAAAFLASVAIAGNPSFDDPTGDPRADAPDDPRFDRSESDDASGDFVPGNSVFEEQFELFGFAPETTKNTALYLDPGSPLIGQPQISGVRADTAWQVQRGRTDVAIAILDSGVRWNREELRRKVRLSCAELPAPRPGGVPVPGSSPGCREPGFTYDVTGDHGIDVDDWIGDPAVDADASPRGTAGKIDAIDLIHAFSDGVDDDANGYVDDIAGWDFFDDDNDPDDSSSYSSSSNHGSGRAEEAVAETNNDLGKAAVCPNCQFVPIRVWDTFVVESNHFALGVAYAADNGIPVVEGAVGGLQNSRFAREAHQYAYERGVALTLVSSDLNTANHNYPTNYNNTIFISGLVADVEPLGIEGHPSFPPVPLGFQVPVGTWFRDSGLTQYGGHSHVSMMGDTGSQATGQAAGAAGLILSHALDHGLVLTANEVKQVLTLTAEDVLPGNTLGTGAPDPTQPGWDQHTGYGRVNLAAALDRVQNGPIPPEATLESPAWFQVLDPDPDGDGTLDASFPITATFDVRGASSASWTLEVGSGIEPAEGKYTVLASGTGPLPFGHGAGLTRPGAPVATIPASAIAAAAFLPGKDFSAPPRSVGPPVQGDARVPSNEFAFTLRLRVEDPNHPGNVGEDRKTLFLHHDPTLKPGFPKFTNVGGESAIRMADIDGDNRLDLVVADSAGELNVYDDSGSSLPGFPVFAPVLPNATSHAGAHVFQSLAPPRATFSTPAVGDLDRDGTPEIVVAAGTEVIVYAADGSVRATVSLNPDFSKPSVRSPSNHLKTGFLAAPTLGDLDGDGDLEIVAAALDQRVYAWHDDGTPVTGWPVYVKDPANPSGSDPGAEIVVSPTLADLDGDGTLEVVVSTNEVYDSNVDPIGSLGGLADVLTDPTQLVGLPAQLVGMLLDLVFGNGVPAPGVPELGGEGRVYAIHADGTAHDGDPDGGVEVDADAFLAGWPVGLPSLLPDALPLVGPGQMAAAADLDGDSLTREVVVAATAGNLHVLRHDGVSIRRMTLTNFGPGSDSIDRTAMLDLFSYPAIADVDLDGDLDVLKAGLSAAGAVNLVLVGQNLPFNHLMGVWDGRTGNFLPAFPKAIDDFQLLTHPVVADVGSPVPGQTDGLPDIVTGTGMYLLRAYNAAGVEPAGFPKLTGGWLQTPPALGDVDGDGLLEIAANTREGNVFLWDTEGPACGNGEWRTHHHDEWNTGNYGQDTRPPDRIVSLTGTRLAGNVVSLEWTAPGDDGACGTAAHYELRISDQPITAQSFGNATAVGSASAPAPAGSPASIAFPETTGATHFALRAVDDAGNPGRLQVIQIP